MIQPTTAGKSARAAAVICVAGVLSAPAVAQTLSDEWQFTALLDGYLPQIGGTTTFPTGQSVNITVDRNQLINNLQFAFMGSIAAQKGPWGGFADVIWADLSGKKSGTRSFSLDGIPIPDGVTADLDLHVRVTVWTFGVSYRVIASPDLTFDTLVGGRGLVVKDALNYQFSGDIGPFVGPGRQGIVGSDTTNWNAIIGVKGRYAFGDHYQWFVPYYFDVGTGGANLTWQALAGFGYQFNKWGDVIVAWRYMDWNFSRNSDSLSLNGPALGVAFHW